MKVYRFVLLLALSIMVSSQAVAAVKWSNSTSKEQDAQTKAERENHWTNNLQKVLPVFSGHFPSKKGASSTHSGPSER